MRLLLSCVLLGFLLSQSPAAQSSRSILIDVHQQVLHLMEGDQEIAKYPISTSKFGLGDAFQSYKTPVGLFTVASKTGADLPEGAVLKHGRFTGEVLRPNTANRDPMVTRMFRLKGLESQNRHAEARGICIHGTPEERLIGRPVSWGCIRMRSRDIVRLFNQTPVGTQVMILVKESEK